MYEELLCGLIFLSFLLLCASVGYLISSVDNHDDSKPFIFSGVLFFIILFISFLRIELQACEDIQYIETQTYNVETIDNVDIIHYSLDESTIKILNLNDHFDRKFTGDEIIIRKKLVKGTYNGIYISDREDIFEIKENNEL